MRFSNAALVVAASCALASAAAASIQTGNRSQDLQRADRALNTQYAATSNGLSAPSRPLLRDAQRAWITFRDQQCRYESSGVRGGSAFPMVQGMCLTRLTVERTRELRRLAQCEEGDLGCPR